ncbi:MAG: hypothetical protein OEZ22_14910 [Spirochaetia bacterium]|nr:hypothetical protein [Spirochaetia bacterium]
MKTIRNIIIINSFIFLIISIYSQSQNNRKLISYNNGFILFERKVGKGNTELTIKKLSKNKKIQNVKKVNNTHAVTLKEPNKLFLCWIMNGAFNQDSYQIIDIESFASNILRIEPIPLSDEAECLIEEDERYFMLYDDFPTRNLMHIFDAQGNYILKKKMPFNYKVEINGKEYTFKKGNSFGGFLPNRD